MTEPRDTSNWTPRRIGREEAREWLSVTRSPQSPTGLISCMHTIATEGEREREAILEVLDAILVDLPSPNATGVVRRWRERVKDR